MNDSFRTDVFVRWHPETIACACIWLAARQLQVTTFSYLILKGKSDDKCFSRHTDIFLKI